MLIFLPSLDAAMRVDDEFLYVLKTDVKNTIFVFETCSSHGYTHF